ncbi:MAG: hypothetical protein IVW56_10855 [Candidatus Binataceae bacterium]|nr:hypothetical protein [Candidatus Binataceae bacterium]
MRKAIYGRGLAIPIGIHVLEEILLNRRASPQELVARLKLTLSLASIRRMVKPCDQLIADDIRSYAATVQPDRPLVSAQIQNAITQGIAELIESDGEEFSEEMVEALELARQGKERFLQVMRAAQEQAAGLAEARSSWLSFEDFFQLAAVPTADIFAQRAGVLEPCRARGRDGLLKVRSVRAAIGVALSLIYGQTFEGWASHLGDSSDLLHVPSAAASAEIFVTDDARLRQALQRGPLDEMRVLGLKEFLAESSPDSDAT